MLRSLTSPSLLAAAMVAALATTQGASADEQAQSSTPATSAQTLQEVVVTAQKRTERLHDVPMGVTAITTDQMDKLRLTDFQDLQALVPGLSVQESQPGVSRITLRGENVGGIGSTVTVYVDDTPVGSSNALADGAIITGDFDTFDLQRVEVLRGPQGTLYGAGSEGGLIKYVTNPPDPTRAAAAFDIGYEDIAHGGSDPLLKGMINMPLTDSAAIRLSGYGAWLPGYIDDPNLNETEINRGEREGGRASLLVNATENFTIRLTAFGQNLRTDGTPTVDVVGAAGTPLTPPANSLQPLVGDYDQTRFINEPSTFRYREFSAKLDWNLGWGALSSITSYGKTYVNLFTDESSLELSAGAPAGGTYGDLAASIVGAPAGLAETDQVNMGKFTQEVRLTSAESQTLEWQVGAFFTREASTIDETLPTFFIPSQALTPLPSLETPHLGAIYREWSGFGEITYYFNPQWDISLGARWSENRQSADEEISGLLVSPPQFTGGTSNGTDWTYSIAPRWHVSDNTLVYARIATGYRPGGPNALPTTITPGVPTSYQADSTTNYELGTRTTFLDNLLSVDVDAFLINWQKIQLSEFVENFTIDANGGSAQSKGFEWTLGLTPVKGLNFLLTGAYVDANLTSSAPAAGGTDGDELSFVPKWSASLDGSYTWPAVSDFAGFVGATWGYTGSRVSDFGASISVVSGAIVFTPDPRTTLPSYNTVNLRAGLENARWTFELYARNIGDTRGITSYANSGTANFGGSITLLQPRTLGAAVTLRF
ncbi:MAG TPA: TonB-dependent receptor [Steroidobacteraceae bacterium]|jgi:iron complex outermembrane receptor protein|nr:TonB-dependent receptor [Steroidobacteraceae bacterium]